MAPHNQITFRVVAIGIAILMLGGALWYRFTPSHTATLATTTPEVLSIEEASARLSLDTDGDGFPDWQEVIRGSDPESATNTPQTVASVQGTATTSSSGADTLARTFVNSYLSATQNGSISLSDPNAFGSALAQTIQEPTIAYTIVLAKDIHTTEDSDDAQNTYQKTLRDVVDPISKASEPEIAIYGRLLEGQASADADLAQTIAVYQSVAQGMRAMTVPKSALLVHLGAVNAIGFYAAVLDAMRTHIADSISSLALMRTYNEAEQNMFANFGALSKYLSQH